MIVVLDRLSTVPSPQDTLREVTVPSGSETEMVRVIGVPVGAVVADSEKLTTGGLSVMVSIATLLFVVRLALSVALRYTVYDPARAYE